MTEERNYNGNKIVVKIEYSTLSDKEGKLDPKKMERFA